MEFTVFCSVLMAALKCEAASERGFEMPEQRYVKKKKKKEM